MIHFLRNPLCKKARGDVLYSENIGLVDCDACIGKYLRLQKFTRWKLFA